MITLSTLTSTPTRRSFSQQGIYGLTRLFAIAIVSREFRDLLLTDPPAAIEQGYLGQPFQLTEDETALLGSIRAESLTDLARQVNRALKTR